LNHPIPYVLIPPTVKNDIMKFAGKRMEVENIILSEVTQTQKDKHDALKRKYLVTCSAAITPPPSHKAHDYGLELPKPKSSKNIKTMFTLSQFDCNYSKTDKDVSKSSLMRSPRSISEESPAVPSS
ncbi:hypothetical protein STEG23_010882, partial [Scotinomys teguina]